MKNLFNTMKARAGIFLLLIGMICFTGFGMTTTDLAKNSKKEISATVDIHFNVVSIPVNQDILSVENNVFAQNAIPFLDAETNVMVFQSPIFKSNYAQNSLDKDVGNSYRWRANEKNKQIASSYNDTGHIPINRNIRHTLNS